MRCSSSLKRNKTTLGTRQTGRHCSERKNAVIGDVYEEVVAGARSPWHLWERSERIAEAIIVPLHSSCLRPITSVLVVSVVHLCVLATRSLQVASTPPHTVLEDVAQNSSEERLVYVIALDRLSTASGPGLSPSSSFIALPTATVSVL